MRTVSSARNQPLVLSIFKRELTVRQISLSNHELSAPTLTEALADEFRRAVNALPPAHRIEPQENELVESPDVGYVRLQDWAFTQGFALVKESSRPERWVLQCIHHKKETKAWRKTPKEGQKRAWTTSQAMGRPFAWGRLSTCTDVLISRLQVYSVPQLSKEAKQLGN